MFLALWNYIRGYVIIYVTGFSVERFINLAVNHGILIWDVEQDRNRVVMKAGVKNTERLKECSIKTGCKFEVAGEYGLPVLLRRCSERRVYISGAFALAAVMYIMSSFIWTVRVVGTERIDSQDILDSCAEKGIAPGRLKHGVDLYKTGEELMMEYRDISWIALNLKGTGITVNIVETIPETEYVEREEPTDVVADSDGVITGIAVSSGTAAVAVGDEVKKGDVLISCVVPLKDGEVQTGEKYVCASGEVFAEKMYDLEGTAPLNYNERVLTGKQKTDYSLDIGGRTFNFITPSLKGEYEEVTKDSLVFDIGDYRVPFGLNKTVYESCETVKNKRTAEKAEEIAAKQLKDKIDALTAQYGGELMGLETETSSDGSTVRVKGRASVVMRIDKQQKADMQNEEVIE